MEKSPGNFVLSTNFYLVYSPVTLLILYTRTDYIPSSPFPISAALRATMRHRVRPEFIGSRKSV